MSPGARRILFSVVAIVAVALAIGIWFVRGPGPMAFADGPKVALADYKAADPTGVPAALAKASVEASLVERGAYLARAADCMACHTTPGGKDYAGGLGFNLPFGTLYSTNITPDRETGIGNYSDQDFLNAVHRGIRRDGARLYPAMPFTSYTYISDADALAIKAYLFSLPPVRAAAPANTLTFPFSQRWAMAFWSALFNPDTRFEPDTSKPPEWNRGAYLAEALAHCGECHTPRNLAFALDNRKKFGGALTAGWRAYNISSDKTTGIGAWRDQDLIAYLATGHAAGHGSASGPMGEAVDRSFSRFAPEDIRAVVAYLRSVPATASTDLPATLAPPAPASHRDGGTADARGKMVFEGTCVSCHGWTGEGSISPFATLTGSWAVNDPAATNVAQIVISGTKRYSEGALSMPGFGNAYSDIEIAAVANYVTARFGARESRLTAQDVAELRKQTAQ
jgi:mono/diheme cytochrome c family protein